MDRSRADRGNTVFISLLDTIAMQSENSHASWHPALMPNSIAGTATRPEPEEESSPQFETPHQSHPEAIPSPDARDLPAAAEEQGLAQESVLNKDDHSELDNLRDALTTSLASPGGVELDENPWHNGEEQVDDEEHEKGDFPSEGPTSENIQNKHLSTMSFARTVSDDVNWGEDDEVDPQWNIQRTDTDPFKMMAKSDRTNSFPAVPPAHDTPSHIQEELPHSQAEAIMHEVEEETEAEDPFGGEGNDAEANLFTQSAAQPDSTGDYFQQSEVDEESRTHDAWQSQGGDFRPEEDLESEARFDEGVPLVQSYENDENPSQAPEAEALFSADADSEEDFFNQASNTQEEPSQPPPLERKSTMQVMDSLHYQPHEQTHPDILEEEDMEGSQGSLANSTGGGIAASSSTILSAVLGDRNAPVHDQPESLAGLELDSGEGDLAAKWKAALAGDEFLEDDDDEFLPDDDEPAEHADFDPATVFGSDDEGFLEDNDDHNDLFSQQKSPPIPTPVLGPNGQTIGFDSLTGPVHTKRPSSSSNRYLPASAGAAALPSPKNAYAPSQPLLTDLSRSSNPAPSPYTSPSVPNFQPQPPRPEMPKAQSFVNQSKGGYTSPYDLPMEVVKPRKRVSMGHTSRFAQPVADVAPPRSSSMHPQAPPPRTSSAGPTASTSSNSFQPGQLDAIAPPSQAQRPKTLAKAQTQSGFFEDLPVSRPKPATRHTSAVPSPLQSPYGPPGSVPPPPSGPGRAAYAPSAVQQHPVQPPMQNPGGLVAPERVSPYASLPVGNVAVPPAASRYSPAPPPLLHSNTAPPPVAQSRYSPAPPSQRQATSFSSSVGNGPPLQGPPVLPHQPRTSSPLAHFERNHDPRAHGSFSETASLDRRSSSGGYETAQRMHPLPTTREVEESEPMSPPTTRNYGELNQYGQQAQPARALSQTPPPPQGLASRLVSSPPKRSTSNYQPQQASHGPPQAFVPPQRSQTQSPGTMYGGPRLETSNQVPYQRPASVEIPTVNNTYQGMSGSASYGRPRGFSQGLNYVAPTDGREHDLLQRWRGAPVFVWGVGGTVMSSFPQDVPRYMNSTAMIIRSPGTVKIRSIKELDPLEERLSTFPGPLKGKSKKKEVVTWLASGIEVLERDAAYLHNVSALSHEDKRIEERILLWKILRVFVENDGTLEGSPVVQKAVRAVLSPGLDDEKGTSAPLYATGADLSGISVSPNTNTRADIVDPAAVDQLRKHLLRGEREKAVWHAVDKRLWAHAMLISNTVSKDLYKQVAQEFVQKEVKIVGDNVESLAALYEIFAGNFEESIDELVPPSARAGFQMVSTSNATGPSKDATDGLDRWRETLGLVLSNRSTDDSQALHALGKLLSGYGRAEAAHICFLFARSLSIFGGIDDPQASIVLVGSDQLRQPYDFDRELEPILLSEVFEYGMSLSNTSAVAVSTPHLAIYKLQHAKILAEYGFRDKALQYCEAISASITSQTRRSPYHHALLVSDVDDLTGRLKQSPKDGKSSWVSKPSIDKAKGTFFATFNKFVAGDEADPAQPGLQTGGAADIGPFSRIAGGTPTISRSPSSSDFGGYNAGLGINGSAPVPITKASSRYAPGHDPQVSTSYGSQPRRSLEERTSNEFRRQEPQRQMSDYQPNSQLDNPYTPQTSSSYTPQSSYTPYGNSGSPYETSPAFTPQTPLTEQPPTNMYASPQALTSFDGQQPSSFTPSEPSYMPQQPSSFDSPVMNSFTPITEDVPSMNTFEAPSYQPQSGGYEPPSSGYTPYEPTEEPDSPIETRPKKKSFMDDDEDDIPALKAQASGGKSKADKDREADAAFRAAAEADGTSPSPSPILNTINTPAAQKGKDAPTAKKGWGLGGWFGGAKKEADIPASSPNKPIKAKLGEASTFVYDADLKRWINKAGGAEATEAKTATAPPPRATGPPRTSSAPGVGGMGPPPPVMQQQARPMPVGAPGMLAQRAVSDVPHSTFSSSPTNPSSHVLHPTSSPSEEHFLNTHPTLQAPPALSRAQSNGSLRSSGPPSRPGTGMSNASSIDDLLGPPVPRVKGGAKGKKKGRGYVDVMAGGDK